MWNPKLLMLGALFVKLTGTVIAQPPDDARLTALVNVTSPPVEPESAGACQRLLGAKLGAGRVLNATYIQPPYSATYYGQTVPVAQPFCLVEGRIVAEPGSEIGFEVWLPTHAQWNGRLLAVGSGAERGDIAVHALARGANRGYATVATDNGHRQQRGFDVTWAFERPVRVVDFGHRAQHLATIVAKAVVLSYYGRAQRYSYFSGCSQGGTKGVASAQRYPADYDGILAGAPVYSWAGEMTMQAWTVRAFTATPSSWLSLDAMTQLYSVIAQRCGGPDGLIANPRACRFDPAELQCPKASEGFCLSTEQVTALHKVYDGPRTSAGQLIYRGLSVGSESAWGRLWDVGTNGIERSGGSWLGVYRYMGFGDPTWTLERLDFDRDPAELRRRLAPYLEQDNPALEAFAARGGKLLVFHGWGDDMVPAESSIDYHAAVARRLGRERTDAFFRLFMVPGMAHCGGGPGVELRAAGERDLSLPQNADSDPMTALQEWVEHGRAPSQLIATRSGEHGAIERSRLVCPVPSQARFINSREPGDPANWRCE